MKNHTFIALLFAALSMPALAGAAGQLDPKYQFAGLEEVKRFQNWSLQGWYPIDRQSLIVRTSPATAYLLILDRQLHGLRFSEGIAISSTGSTVYGKFDTVRTHGRQRISIPAQITKIYKLQGREQRELVKAQIRGA